VVLELIPHTLFGVSSEQKSQHVLKWRSSWGTHGQLYSSFQPQLTGCHGKPGVLTPSALSFSRLILMLSTVLVPSLPSLATVGYVSIQALYKTGAVPESRTLHLMMEGMLFALMVYAEFWQ